MGFRHSLIRARALLLWDLVMPFGVMTCSLGSNGRVRAAADSFVFTTTPSKFRESGLSLQPSSEVCTTD